MRSASPLSSGCAPSERVGQSAFWLIFIGFNLTFLNMHLTGLIGMPRRVYTYSAGLGWEWLNLISTIGGFVLTIGFALFFLDLLLQVYAGRRTSHNPWQAGSLEWSLAHPPANYNLAALVPVESREPLWDQPRLVEDIHHGRGYLARARNGWQETLGVDAISGKPDQIILLAGIGAAAALAAGLRWTWQSGLTRDYPDQDAGAGLMLPLHPQVHDAPGWWGMVVGLLVNGTFYISLLFGYLYLWAVAPGWPPASYIDINLFWPLATALFAVLGAWACQRAVRLAVAGQPPVLALSAALLLGLLATAAYAGQVLIGLPSPATHAYVAVTTFLLGYCGLHTLLTGVFAGYALLRWRAGYISAKRSLELRVIRLWALYSAGITLISLGLVHGLPTLLGISR